MSATLEPLFWLIFVTLVMLLLKRWVHQHVQMVGYLLTGDVNRAFLFYSLLFFPGTVVHETAHYLAAHLLDVRVRKFSLMPARPSRGMMRLGFVEIDRTDAVREALIGIAPLIAGSAAILLITQRGLLAAQDSKAMTAQLSELVASLPQALRLSDFWLLLYLTFTISNGMLPSDSDRQAWTPVLLWLGAMGALLYLSGLVTRIPDPFDRGIALGVGLLVRAFALACLVDAFFMPLIWFVEKVLERIPRRRGTR
ncbi:MAG: hypothetical protein HYR71_08095 [Chloroflexi bacterium]|nr:hypothetical protein [Chloroflexota bacterium]